VFEGDENKLIMDFWLNLCTYICKKISRSLYTYINIYIGEDDLMTIQIGYK
jgi:hypothetical protein